MIFGLHGYARTGKDTVADYLVKQHGFNRVALADAVRDTVYTLNPYLISDGFSARRLQEAVDELGWDAVKATAEGRRLLQVMGTEVGRQLLGENVWLDIASRKIRGALGPVVITDVRFANELDWLYEIWDGHGVKIVRPGFGPVNAHSSDAGIPDDRFEFIISNRGTIDELHENIEFVLDEVDEW